MTIGLDRLLTPGGPEERREREGVARKLIVMADALDGYARQCTVVTVSSLLVASALDLREMADLVLYGP